MNQPDPIKKMEKTEKIKKKEKMEKKVKERNPPIPRKLKIIVETNLPGYRKFRYDPLLTLPSAPSHNVYFNPLQPLDKDILKKIPKRERILAFFNSGMFHRLNYYTSLFRSPTKSLKEACEKGNIDNNIRNTLDTLFSTNSVFYIHREKYYIAFFEWQQGNWTLETQEPKKYTKEELYGPNATIKELELEPKLEKEQNKKIKGGLNENLYEPLNKINLYPRYNTYKQRQGINPRRTYKRGRSHYLKKGPYYQIQIFLSLKKGEPWTAEELTKIPCQKQWQSITHSYQTVTSDTTKKIKSMLPSNKKDTKES